MKGYCGIFIFASFLPVIFGHSLFQNFDKLPDFIAEKSDGETRTILLHYGRVSGIHQTTTRTVEESGVDKNPHVVSIVTNGMVLAKIDSAAATKDGIGDIEKCYISADKQTVEEFLYVFDENFRGIEVEGITFLMEIPGSEVSEAVVSSDYANPSSHSESDSSRSESGTSTDGMTANLEFVGTSHPTAWDEWNIRHGIDNLIPHDLQRVFDHLLLITDHCMSTESKWKHVHSSEFVLPGTEPGSHTSTAAVPNRARRNAGIYPGTVWCGIGDVASTFDDVGTHNDTDVCCRAHDFCPNFIAPFSYGHGYFNLRPYTVNHCDCDLKLRQCFRDVNTTVSLSVAHLFFNVFQPECFTLQTYETCTSKSWWGRCYEYGMVQKAIVRDNLPW